MMAKADFSFKQHLRKAMDALQHEHAGEMLSPRYKRCILDADEQTSAPLPSHSGLPVLLRSGLSRVNFIYNPVMILKDRVVRKRAYSGR